MNCGAASAKILQTEAAAHYCNQRTFFVTFWPFLEPPLDPDAVFCSSRIALSLLPHSQTIEVRLTDSKAVHVQILEPLYLSPVRKEVGILRW